MADLDTKNSDAVIEAFGRRRFVAARRVITCTRIMPASADTVFDLLCPTREHDWIDGWVAEMIFSESGYVEDGCVLRTGEDNVTGSGVWLVSHREPPSLLKIVRVRPHLAVHLVIALSVRGDGSCELRWTATATGLDDPGNEMVAALPAGDAAVAGSAEKLTHYLETGSMKRRAD